MGVVGRATTHYQASKYMPVYPSSGFPIHSLLYGDNVAWDNQRRRTKHKSVVLVEGQMAVLNLRRYELDAVALMGTTMTVPQQRLLSDYGNVTVLLDGDGAGTSAAPEVARYLAATIPHVALCSGHDDDPDGWDRGKIEDAVRWAMAWPMYALTAKVSA